MIVLLSAGAAQSLAGSNTVTSDDIVDGTISTQDLKAGSVSGSKLLNNGITSGKIYNGTLTAADLGTNSVGSEELVDNGVTGADVNEATLDLDLPEIDARTSFHYADVPAHGFVVAYCPEGYVATGGGDPLGPGIGSENYGVTREGLFPMNGETVAGWTVQNPSDSPQRIYVQVVCLKF